MEKENLQYRNISSELSQEISAETKLEALKWLEENSKFFSAEMNGYLEIPKGPYLSTLPLINQSGKILDLGCGNGMLLKFLMQFSGYDLDPYGVDVNSKAIEQAENEVLTEFSDNFSVQNVNDYDFSEGPFEIIIGNPSYSKKELQKFTERCLKNLISGGRLIYRVHDDVIRRNKITSLDDVPEFQGMDIKIIQGSGLVLAVIDKK